MSRKRRTLRGKLPRTTEFSVRFCRPTVSPTAVDRGELTGTREHFLNGRNRNQFSDLDQQAASLHYVTEKGPNGFKSRPRNQPFFPINIDRNTRQNPGVCITCVSDLLRACAVSPARRPESGRLRSTGRARTRRRIHKASQAKALDMSSRRIPCLLPLAV